MRKSGIRAIPPILSRTARCPMELSKRLDPAPLRRCFGRPASSARAMRCRGRSRSPSWRRASPSPSLLLAVVLLVWRSRAASLAGRHACDSRRHADARHLSRRRVLGDPSRHAGRHLGADRRAAAADHRRARRPAARREDPAAPLARPGARLRRRHHRAVAEIRRDRRRRHAGDARRRRHRGLRHEPRHDLAEALRRRHRPGQQRALPVSRRGGADGGRLDRLRDAHCHHQWRADLRDGLAGAASCRSAPSSC